MFQYLKDIGDGSIAKETPDCSVTDYCLTDVPDQARETLGKTRLISTTDFFYPLVEDPYIQGRISCCNVLSDIYAMGISRVDHMLMVLGVSLQMKPNEREVITREMIRGFNDCATEAGTKITGGQSIMNPWPIIGGVANVTCQETEFTRPNFGQPGDILILTKPLGTQPAVNLKQTLSANPNFFDGKGVTAEQVNDAYYLAMESMATLNRGAAELMKKYGSHGATDVTGFGILGHAKNLAAAQKNEVDLVIENLPVISQMNRKIDGMHDFKVLEGFSAETSGGILTMVKPGVT